MLGKMERKILAGLLAASMCMTCLPVGMGQVRAEENAAETEAMTEEPDYTPELTLEPSDETGGSRSQSAG